jgi:hypothetical protein
MIAPSQVWSLDLSHDRVLASPVATLDPRRHRGGQRRPVRPRNHLARCDLPRSLSSISQGSRQPLRERLGWYPALRRCP